MNESALVIIKPDGIQRGLIGPVLDRYETPFLRLIGIKMAKVTRALAAAHYEQLRNKPFFEEIINYLSGKLNGIGSVLVMVYYGDQAIKRCRAIAGATNPEEANPRSIRGAFGRITTKGVYENVVHVSSNAKEARREIRLWFTPAEVRGFSQHIQQSKAKGRS
ncbi:MAG: nucleoside-diphosphate kinase [Candidatus Omnitrophota bacterium]|nr:nucleoside-diphosphate kinase [Candidatus Omnitrophota bacterium]